MQPLLDYLESYGSTFVLDAGCGDGVHVDLLTRDANVPEDRFFVGLDISMSALRVSKRRAHFADSKYAFVRADVGRLPFGDNWFDAVFSFGVLAYSDNPFYSFSELCRVIRTGGFIGIWVYPQTQGVCGALFSLVRKACQLTGSIGCRLIADCIVPFLGFLPTRSKMSLANASWQQCREVVLVNIAPRQLHFPDSAEVENWFTKNNFRIICQDDANPITLWGKKC